MGDRALPLQSGEPIIAVEEHYWDAELAATFPPGRRGAERLEAKLRDFGAARIKAMDEAGIDMQVLSHGSPSTQVLPADVAVALSRRVNDRLHAAIEAFPERLAGFAALPTADPTAAADELERTVTRLGFKGAMIHGLANGLFLDHQRFWPIFERAERLGVPIYMHPSVPHPAVVDAYYKEYVDAFPTVVRAAWGFTVETATQALRLVLSGLFEAYPRLKIVLGHLGETLPFFFGGSTRRLRDPARRRSVSARSSAKVSTSPRAGSSRRRRSTAASRRWARSASSSPSTIPISRTPRAPPGFAKPRLPRPTARRSPALTPSACFGYEWPDRSR